MTEERTRRRFERRARGRLYVAADLGRDVCGQILPELSKYMRSDAPKPPAGLETAVRQLSADDLALAALGPLLHQSTLGGIGKTHPRS